MRAGIAVAPITLREPGSPAAQTWRFCVRDVMTPDEYERAWREPVFRFLVAYIEGLTSLVLPTFSEIAEALLFREWRLRRRLARVGVRWRELRARLVAHLALQLRGRGMKMLVIARMLGYGSPQALRRALVHFLGLRRGLPLPSGGAVFETVPLFRSRAPRWLRSLLARGQNDGLAHAGAADEPEGRDEIVLLDAQRHAELG